MAAWIDQLPLPLLIVAIAAAMTLAAGIGVMLRRKLAEDQQIEDGQEAYVVSAVLGLLALFMGFTLSLSLDRFETRRTLVVEEANAIGTVYLRTQLLPDPHRDRIENLLTSYLDNRIAFSDGFEERAMRLQIDDQLNIDLWAATAAAFDAIRGIDFSSAYLDSMNDMLDLDASRKAAHAARVPAEVFGLLLIFVLVGAGLMGFVLTGRRKRIAAALLLVLLALALGLMLDIDRPSAGLVNEPQDPLFRLRETMATGSHAAFDRWRAADGGSSSLTVP